HHELRPPLQRHGNLPRRSVSGDRGQSLHLVLHDRQRKRQVRIRMDRRQRVFRDRIRGDISRMKFCAAIACAALLVSTAVRAGEIPPEQRRSGYSFMAPDTKAIQDDDTSNPGMLFALDGEKLWSKKIGSADKACADCHGDAAETMKGVAARYPAFDKALGRP